MRGFLVLSSLPLASMGICSIFVQTRISPRVEAATVDTPDLYFLPLSVFGDTDKPSDGTTGSTQWIEDGCLR